MKLRYLPLALSLGITPLLAQAPAPTATPRPAPPVHKLVLTSPAFKDGEDIPVKFTAAGVAPAAPGNPPNPAPSPELNWTGAPEKTASFIVTIIDEEYAPQGNQPPFYHWVIFNIPASAKGLPENVAHEKELHDGSIQPQMGRRIPGYGGMGAPATDERHHYIFRVIALDTKLDLGPDATIDQINAAMNGHILDRGLLVARFHRPAQ